MSANTFVVYEPPRAGLPYLSVLVGPTGRITALPFATEAEARAHSERIGARDRELEAAAPGASKPYRKPAIGS